MKTKVTFHLPKEDLKMLLRLANELGVVSMSRLAEKALDHFMKNDVRPSREKELDAKLIVKLRRAELEGFREECEKRGYHNTSQCFADAVEQWLSAQLQLKTV